MSRRRVLSLLAGLTALGCAAACTAPGSAPPVPTVSGAARTAPTAPHGTTGETSSATAPVPTSATTPAPTPTANRVTTRTTTRATGSATTTPRPPVPGASVALPAGVAPEASGLTPARGADGVFWTVDDATGADELVALDLSGRQVGVLHVDGMSAGNAEALSGGPCTPGGSARCLYVGDLGDHTGRDHVVVYQIPEPESPRGEHTAQAQAWDYTYADGARNAEAMFVQDDGLLVVIDKPERQGSRTVAPHQVYRAAPGGGVFLPAGRFTPPPPTTPVQSLFEGNVVTDAALQQTGGRTRVLLQFYDQVVQYTAPSGRIDPSTFFRWPRRALPGPALIQPEGIAGLADGCGYTSISEAGPGGSVAHLVAAPCG